MRVKSTLFLCFSLFVFGCGGSQPAAQEPSESASSDKGEAKGDETAEADKEKGDEKAEAKAGKSDSEPKKEAKDDSSSTSGPKVTRTAKDILTAPDVIFMLSFNQSDMKEQAEKQCDAQAKDNPKKRADCMTKAKQKIDIDGLAFKQEKGNWYWLSVKRKGKTLINVHKLPVEFIKEEDHSIVLKPTGKDEGRSPGSAPGETKVEVPNEYEIVIQDPKLGKVVYEAKIGLTGADNAPR